MVPSPHTARPSPLGLPGCLLPVPQLLRPWQGRPRPPAAPSLPEPPRYEVCSDAGGFQVIWPRHPGPPVLQHKPSAPPQCPVQPRSAHSRDGKARGAGGVQQGNGNTGTEPHGGAASCPPRGGTQDGNTSFSRRDPRPAAAPNSQILLAQRTGWSHLGAGGG